MVAPLRGEPARPLAQLKELPARASLLSRSFALPRIFLSCVLSTRVDVISSKVLLFRRFKMFLE